MPMFGQDGLAPPFAHDGSIPLSRSKVSVRENGVLNVTEISGDEEWQGLLFEHFGVRL